MRMCLNTVSFRHCPICWRIDANWHNVIERMLNLHPLKLGARSHPLRVVVLSEIPRPFVILPLLPGRFAIHLQPLRRTAVFPNTHEHPPQSLAHRPARLEVPQPLKCFPHRVNCRCPFSPASLPIRLHHLDTRLSPPSDRIPLEELLPT